MGIKDKYTVKSIDSFQCKDWLLHKHYAKRMPQIMFSFGLFLTDSLVGICTFGIPANQNLCYGICGREYEKIVLELNRLCLSDNNKNEASFFVSKCLNMIPKPSIVVSYADTSQNHHGYIYQATNFLYTGLSAKRTERYDINHPNKHTKTVSDNDKIDYQSLAVRDRARKHRYVYFIGNKREKKNLLAALKYKLYPYPKGDNKRYDASYKPTVQQQLF